MGIVYEAWDPRLEREVALKVITPRPGGDAAEARVRLMREARVMAQLSHPNLVSSYDVGETEGRMFVAMQLVRGTTLRAWADDPAHSFDDRLRVMIAAGRGLAAAHAAQIVHRDFKPENVLIGADRVPRVTDFGIARRLEVAADAGLAETHLTRTGAILGTPAYMSPEQVYGEVPTAATDQFSFCITAWEILAGQRPFLGTTAAAVIANMLSGAITPAPAEATWAAALSHALRRGLALDPADRFPRMVELITALELALARTPPRPRPTRGLGAAAAAIALVLGLGTAVALGTARVDSIAPVVAPPTSERIEMGSDPIPAPPTQPGADPSSAAIAPRGPRRTPRASETGSDPISDPGPASAAPPVASRAATSAEGDDPSEVTRLGRIELPMVDGIRAERDLRLDDIPNYRALVIGARAAIERGDAAGARAGMRAMRVAIDGVTIDAAFVAAKAARLVAKRADVRGPDDQLAALDAELASGKQAAAAGRFREANHALDLAARRFTSEY